MLKKAGQKNKLLAVFTIVLAGISLVVTYIMKKTKKTIYHAQRMNPIEKRQKGFYEK